MEAAGAGERVRLGEAAFFGFGFLFWSDRAKSFLIEITASNKHILVLYTWHVAFYVSGVSKIA